jgi:type II secretory pathway pseudopilin PulG
MQMLRSPLAGSYKLRRTPNQKNLSPCSRIGPHGDNSESGYVLLAVLFLVAIILIGLAVAAPKMAQDIRRDKETELYHRGLQYARAIRLYYRLTGNYPTDLSQLENTNNIRFLRKRYVDPITGQPFRIIHQGEAKVPLFGLFGQPLGIQPPGAGSIGTPVGTPIGGAPVGATTGPNILTSSNNTSTDSSSTTTTTSPNGTTNPGTGTGTGAFGSATGSGTSTGLGSAGSTGSTTVIGRIVGVSSTSPKDSIRVYKKQTHYNQWEFVYDPASEGILGGGQPGLNAPGGTTNPSGISPTSGGSPTSPTTPTNPQSTPTPPATSQ